MPHLRRTKQNGQAVTFRKTVTDLQHSKIMPAHVAERASAQRPYFPWNSVQHCSSRYPEFHVVDTSPIRSGISRPLLMQRINLTLTHCQSLRGHHMSN
jgi:hypothetical protein